PRHSWVIPFEPGHPRRPGALWTGDRRGTGLGRRAWGSAQVCGDACHRHRGAVMEILIGTSGFSYEDWRGFFYPEDLPKREMLAYYAEHFPTVEVNATYYSMPSPATFA